MQYIPNLLTELRHRLALGKRVILIGNEPYGVHFVVPDAEVQAQTERGEVEIRFAKDDCGNWYLLRLQRDIVFVDHETDDRKVVADDLASFVNLLQQVHLDVSQGKVISAWIDPDFRKSLQQKGSNK